MIRFWSEQRFHIGRAVPDDAPRMAEIHKGSFFTGWSRTDILNMIREDRTLCLVSRPVGRPDTVAGFIIVRKAADEAEVLTIATANDYRRKGLGRALLEESFRLLYADGVRHLFLEVAEDNSSAVSLYQKCGFQDVSRREAYYKRADGKNAAACVMRADL